VPHKNSVRPHVSTWMHCLATQFCGWSGLDKQFYAYKVHPTTARNLTVGLYILAHIAHIVQYEYNAQQVKRSGPQSMANTVVPQIPTGEVNQYCSFTPDIHTMMTEPSIPHMTHLFKVPTMYLTW
jgi:hypothetical protein